MGIGDRVSEDDRGGESRGGRRDECGLIDLRKNYYP